MKNNRTKMIAGVGLLTAVVVVLQLLGSFIHFGPFSISLVLVPIVVGAALYGPAVGAWLGLVFGVVVLLSGDAGAFMAVNPLGAILICIIKGAAAGFFAGLVFNWLEKSKGTVWATIAAAIVSPVANTGIFLLGAAIFFMDLLTQWAASFGFASVGAYMIFGLVGLNFLAEMVINMVLSPVIVRLIRLRRNMD